MNMSRHQPYVSVIVPLWQPWDATKKLWKSLRRQTIPYEIITVRGRGRAPAARNAGAAAAQGEYLFFCDQDVELEPTCLEYMLNALQSHPSVGYAYCDYKRSGVFMGLHRAQPFDAALLRVRNYIDTCSLMRNSVFPGFDESIGRLQDWDVWLTLLKRGVTGVYIPRVLYTKYYRQGDISTQDNYQQWHTIVSRKHRFSPFSARQGSFFCPVCESAVKHFIPGGRRLRPGARCPVCGSLERHRLVWLYFQHNTDFFQKPCAFLHIAPEPPISRRLRERSDIRYVPADLHPQQQSIQRMDVTSIPYPDNCFDVIYASHVLEHIMDDRKAIHEFHRALRPGGRAVLLVPIAGTRTKEGEPTMSPLERERAFGQEDHVRSYGTDFADRLREATWSVTEDSFASTFSPEDRRRYGLRSDEHIYCCIKPRPRVTQVLSSQNRTA